MGFADEDFNKLKAIYPGRKGKLSSILYRQAGNSIVVNVLKVVLKEILEEIKNEKINNI
ncbi:hypothetical protein [Metamycoplasma equirhinis]|uniref:hypothetical protein n=1 Tax=Metamycoplasma equirhinis TaxID=92402 RepID=UPI003593FBAE